MRAISTRTVISASNAVNLYRGCTHGCIYCDSRSHCYQVTNFDDPEYKQNAIEIMRQELSRRRNKAMITTGAMSDPYLHMEAELCLTQKMLKLIKEFGFGVGILTKSDLALRDIDLISAINDRYFSSVCYTVTTADDRLCQILEPFVCSTSRRFACLEKFAARGINTGVWMVPVLPFINDDENNIREIVRRCADAGVAYIMNYGIGTTMRDGSREYFYSQLDRLFPGMKERYIKEFGCAYICKSPKHRDLEELFINECRRHNILCRHDEIFKLAEPPQVKQLKLNLE